MESISFLIEAVLTQFLKRQSIFSEKFGAYVLLPNPAKKYYIHYFFGANVVANVLYNYLYMSVHL